MLVFQQDPTFPVSPVMFAPKYPRNKPEKAFVAFLIILFAWPGMVQSAEGPGWGHLIFNEETNPVQPVPDSKDEQGKSMAVLVSPKDNRDWDHRANSILAKIVYLEYAPGGKASWKPSGGKSEKLLVVTSGSADVQIGSFQFHVEKEDFILVPAGMPFKAKVTGDEPLRLVKAVWTEDAAIPDDNVPPVVRSEATYPFSYFSRGGHITMTPSARQKDTGLAIVGVGGHTKLSASLMFYPEDLESRDFIGNSLMIRSALSQYGAGGGGTGSHSHHGREQAFLILSGRGLFEIGPTTSEAKTGDLVFAPKHVFHGCKVIGDEPLKYLEMEWSHAW